MTVLLEDTPLGSCDNLLQPQTGTLSALWTAVNSEPRHPAKQDLVARETPWEQREGTRIPQKGHEAIIGQES